MINTTELKSQINAIINRYNLSDFKEQLNNVIQGDGIKIGFLGAFSSGKTSLLNLLKIQQRPKLKTPTYQA